jgi:hypothetical protein
MDVMPPSHDSNFHVFDNLTSIWSDSTEADYSHTAPTNPISDACNDDVPNSTASIASDEDSITSHSTPTSPSTLITPSTLSQQPNYILDVSKIYTQNVHGLWCRPRDSAGNIIRHSDRDNTKLEHMIHQMRTHDIDA